MNQKDKKQIINDLDSILHIIDLIISGKSNFFFKSELNELRNKIVELQDKYG